MRLSGLAVRVAKAAASRTAASLQPSKAAASAMAALNHMPAPHAGVGPDSTDEQLLVAARQSQALRRLDRLFGAVGIEIDVHGVPF